MKKRRAADYAPARHSLGEGGFLNVCITATLAATSTPRVTPHRGLDLPHIHDQHY